MRNLVYMPGTTPRTSAHVQKFYTLWTGFLIHFISRTSAGLRDNRRLVYSNIEGEYKKIKYVVICAI